MIKLKDLLKEGVYDQGTFKAVFMAGGSGSGKGTVSSILFGIPKKIFSRLSSFGLKVLNIDDISEFLMKKDKVDLSKLGDMDKKDMGIYWARSKKRFNILWDTYTKGRLGILIDSTAGAVHDIKKQKAKLEELGYDTYMVFVEVPKEVAIERNQKRGKEGGRQLTDEMVSRNWDKVQANKKELKSLFKSNFSDVVADGSKDIIGQAQKPVNTFIKKPVKNKEALKWIDKALEMKKR
tara:strand:+ start:1092 stop:1799 length:708 start_codon:yes stop_codon:yes gene_type:complete